MKPFIFIAILILSTVFSKAQTVDQVIPRQFQSTFPNNESRGNLNTLRDFLDTKDAEYTRLKSDLQRINYNNFSEADTVKFLSHKKLLEKFLGSHNKIKDSFEKSEVDDDLQYICYEAVAIDSTTHNGITRPLFNIRKALRNVEFYLFQIAQIKKIQKSIDNVTKDRDAAARAIQRIYNIENWNQWYKQVISIAFAFIILFLIMISFWFLYKKSTSGIGNDFLNGNGLQFIALFAIIISTILFGILDILQGKELAAILSGIAGFILGKGLNVNLTNKPSTDTTTAAST